MSALTPASREAVRSSRSMLARSSTVNAARVLSSGPVSATQLDPIKSQSRFSASRLPHQMAKLQRSMSSAIPTSSLLSYRTLPNGIRVAGEETPGHFSALGVYVNTGSRFEREYIPGESGVSHLLDRMAFKSTKECSHEDMTARIAKLGGNFQAASSRETIMYQGSMFNQDLPEAMSIFADTILQPQLKEAELDELRPSVDWEVQELSRKPEAIIPELLHTTAYNGKTLGKPLLCSPESMAVMKADNIRDFMKTWYTPDRIVIAGAGMPFNQLYELSDQLFSDMENVARKTASSSSSRYNTRSQQPRASSANFAADFSTTSKASAKVVDIADLSTRQDIASQKAVYTGGQQYISDPKQDFTHIYVAFESMSIEDEDIYALSVLQTLLGGGSSFSAGGPGKGMYSRLYSNVLNQHHSVDYCAAFHHCYADSGLFGIAIAVDSSFNAYVHTIIIRELEAVCNPTSRNGVREEELTRAKNQLKSSLTMSLESRLIEVEDLGRQVQVNGKKVTIEEMCEKIDRVDMANLGRVARRVLQPGLSGETLNSGEGSGKATVVAMGNLDGLPDNMAEILASRGIGAPP